MTIPSFCALIFVFITPRSDSGRLKKLVRHHLDHVLGVILLSSVTCAFEHVAGCHVVFLFLEILRKESMFFALVKNGRHLKTRATTCTEVPCKKTWYFVDEFGSKWSLSTSCTVRRKTKWKFPATQLLVPDLVPKWVDWIFFHRVKNMLLGVS